MAEPARPIPRPAPELIELVKALARAAAREDHRRAQEQQAKAAPK